MSCDFQPPSRSFGPASPPRRLFICQESPVTGYEISRRPSPFRSASYKMLFPQLLCFENDPFFMGVCTPLNEEVMNSTIANSSSTIDIPEVTSRNDSSLPHAPKEGRCQHIFPNGKRCRKFASGSHLGLCLHHLTESAAIGAGFQQPPNDSLDLSGELLPRLSEFDSAVDINKFLAKLLVLVTKGRVSPRRASVLAYITNQLLLLASRHRPR